jgi:hypothetical protein
LAEYKKEHSIPDSTLEKKKTVDESNKKWAEKL